MTSREEWRKRGELIRTQINVADEREEVAPGYRGFDIEAIYGGIWARPGLELEDRVLCTLVALSLTQRMPQLRRLVRSALNIGLPPRSILEIFVHVGLYGGFPTAENSCAAAREVFAEEGVEVEDDPPDTADREALKKMGDETLVALHGARGRDGYAAPDNPVTGGLYEIAIDYGYGALWNRPGLDRRQRMLCAVAGFTALEQPAQLKKFGQSALNVGLTREEILEAVIQTAPYSGFPRALNGLMALGDVLG